MSNFNVIYNAGENRSYSRFDPNGKSIGKDDKGSKLKGDVISEFI